jgi:threonine aldolase
MIDLRSDTVTRPTEAMLQAMMSAKVGDDVFNEDPTIRELENTTAEIFGKEAGLFCPSGTMTNQIAIALHTRPGDEVICHKSSHIYLYEGGGMMANSGVSPNLLEGERGQLKASQIRAAIRPDDPHFPNSTLISLENTMNKGGGSVYSLLDLQGISELGKEVGVGRHLDGARIFNALDVSDYTAKDVGECFDSISICLSKGLGAPVGSVLIGEASFIHRARRVRKRFGGGMRQAGYLAAAGLYALENNVNRLSEDHRRAKGLGLLLLECSWVESVQEVETNIVIANVKDGSVSETLMRLEKQGIQAVAFGPTQIRFVTHLDFSEEDLKRMANVLPLV